MTGLYSAPVTRAGIPERPSHPGLLLARSSRLRRSQLSFTLRRLRNGPQRLWPRVLPWPSLWRVTSIWYSVTRLLAPARMAGRNVGANTRVAFNEFATRFGHGRSHGFL